MWCHQCFFRAHQSDITEEILHSISNVTWTVHRRQRFSAKPPISAAYGWPDTRSNPMPNILLLATFYFRKYELKKKQIYQQLLIFHISSNIFVQFVPCIGRIDISKACNICNAFIRSNSSWIPVLPSFISVKQHLKG